MIKQIAIAVAGISAAFVLAVGLVAAGFSPRPAGADPGGTEVLAAPLTAIAPTAEPTPEPEIVYVQPAAAAGTVVVERQAATRNAVARSVAASRSSGQTRLVRAVREDDDHDRREDDEDHERDDD
jgi:hypothetical protein